MVKVEPLMEERPGMLSMFTLNSLQPQIMNVEKSELYSLQQASAQDRLC